MEETRRFRPTLRQEQKIKIESQRSNDSQRARFCAYNKTGQRFISNLVELADASAGDFENGYPSLTPGSGTAVWVVPIRSLSATSFCVPVDLLYLDVTCAVLATVESFPTRRISTSIAKAASILALPVHTILTMGIEVGDQLALSSRDEMQSYLVNTSITPGEAGSNWPAENQDRRSHMWEQQLREVREQLREVREQLDSPAGSVAPEPAKVEEMQPVPNTVPQPPRGGRNLKTRWWQKLRWSGLFDPRQGVRTELPGLVAYFFTGGAPTPNPVRDISTSGLYVVTPERWYHGTLVRLTLTDVHNPSAERSIAMLAEVVRSTDDGVAFKFRLPEKSEWLRGVESTLERLQGGNNTITDIEELVSLLKSGS